MKNIHVHEVNNVYDNLIIYSCNYIRRTACVCVRMQLYVYIYISIYIIYIYMYEIKVMHACSQQTSAHIHTCMFVGIYINIPKQNIEAKVAHAQPEHSTTANTNTRMCLNDLRNTTADAAVVIVAATTGGGGDDDDGDDDDDNKVVDDNGVCLRCRRVLPMLLYVSSMLFCAASPLLHLSTLITYFSVLL